MNILVVGGTRGTGRQVVEQALAAGHTVGALARRPEAIALEHPRLEVLRGDVLDPRALERAVAGRDAVLSTLGVVRLGEMFREVTLYSAGGRNLATAMERAAVARFIGVTSGGVERDDPAFGFFYKHVLKPLFIQRAYDDMVRFESALRTTRLAWTVVRPTQLTDGPRTGQYRVSSRFAPPGGAKISRADVADFMLRELGDPRYVHGTPTLAY